VVPISALSGEGVDICSSAPRPSGCAKARSCARHAAGGAGEAIAWLHANGEVVDQRSDGLRRS
jgi:hypothetical protein